MDPGARSRRASADPGAIENGRRLTKRPGQISIYTFLRRIEGRTRHLSRFLLPRQRRISSSSANRERVAPLPTKTLPIWRRLLVTIRWTFCSMFTRSPTSRLSRSPPSMFGAPWTQVVQYILSSPPDHDSDAPKTLR